MPNVESGLEGQLKECGTHNLSYSYGTRKSKNSSAPILMEREPKRTICLKDPNTFHGLK